MFTYEATSALDAESEKKVKLTLDNILKELKDVVVAHRLSTIKNADIIYAFDTGRTVEQDTHAELVEKRRAYYNLVMRQLSAKAETTRQKNADNSDKEKTDNENNKEEKEEMNENSDKNKEKEDSSNKNDSEL